MTLDEYKKKVLKEFEATFSQGQWLEETPTSFATRFLSHALDGQLAVVRGMIENVPVERAHTYASENADVYRAFDAGQADYKNRILLALSPSEDKTTQ